VTSIISLVTHNTSNTLLSAASDIELIKCRLKILAPCWTNSQLLFKSHHRIWFQKSCNIKTRKTSGPQKLRYGALVSESMANCQIPLTMVEEIHFWKWTNVKLSRSFAGYNLHSIPSCITHPPLSKYQIFTGIRKTLWTYGRTDATG